MQPGDYFKTNTVADAGSATSTKSDQLQDIKGFVLLPCTICEALSDGHLTSSSEHHPELVTFQHEVEATLGAQMEGRGGGGYQHVSPPHCRQQTVN